VGTFWEQKEALSEEGLALGYTHLEQTISEAGWLFNALYPEYTLSQDELEEIVLGGTLGALSNLDAHVLCRRMIDHLVYAKPQPSLASPASVSSRFPFPSSEHRYRRPRWLIREEP
jgi:hypothetical protein